MRGASLHFLLCNDGGGRASDEIDMKFALGRVVRIGTGVAVLATIGTAAVANDPAKDVVDRVIKEQVDYFLDRFDVCRTAQLSTVTECFKDWAGDKATKAMIDCLGEDRVPGDVTAAQKRCIFLELDPVMDEGDLF
jgi:hypothetical protein